MHIHSNEDHSAHEKSLSKSFLIGIIINFIFVVIEFFCGYFYNSVALTADAWHNTGDVAGLVVSLLAFKLADRKPNNKYTFGYSKATILASLLSTILLMIAVINIGYEAVYSLKNPVHPPGKIIWIVALIGVFVNTITAFQFHNKSELNSKAAFLHLAGDALVSIGVMITGILIQFWNIPMLDSITALLIAVVILIGAIPLLKSSLKLSLDGVPENVDLVQIKNLILKTQGVLEITHLHIWPLSTTRNAIILQIKMKEKTNNLEIKNELRHTLFHAGISHVTIETDWPE